MIIKILEIIPSPNFRRIALLGKHSECAGLDIGHDIDRSSRCGIRIGEGTSIDVQYRSYRILIPLRKGITVACREIVPILSEQENMQCTNLAFCLGLGIGRAGHYLFGSHTFGDRSKGKAPPGRFPGFFDLIFRTAGHPQKYCRQQKNPV